MHETSDIDSITIELSLKGDAAVPEHISGALGAVRVGPGGFLRLLETQLGIPAHDVSFTTRLIQYLGCIDRVDHHDAFYARSYSEDPFSVARTLLQWRDAWYMAGWQGSFAANAPTRLAAMAAIETLAAEAVEPGIGQRIQRVLQLLQDNPVAVGAVHLHDALADFPHLWQQLLSRFDAIEPVSEPTDNSVAQDTDLQRLQHHLRSDSTATLTLQGDGTVMALHAESAQSSTLFTAMLAQRWLNAAPEQSTALLAESRGVWLDNALALSGTARVGFTALSSWRPVFQVLPLSCELLWAPLNPTALFQFLSHPVGPIPSRIREVLARTVADTPGIGSQAWQDALQACLANEDEPAREALAQSLRYWLECDRFHPHQGVDSAIISERAQRVAQWLQAARETHDDPARRTLYNIALNQAEEFVAAIQRLKQHGRERLTQDNVRRLIEDVRGSGAPVTDRQAEVIPHHPRLLRADHAGACMRPVDNMIWWDCQANDRVHRWPWSLSERAALAAAGVHLQTEDEQLNWLGKAWLRPVLSARERCVFILHDDAERHHPLWEQIANITQGLPVLSVADSATAAQLGIAQQPLATRQLPPKVRWWHLPANVTQLEREAESFSSLDTYIHSPYQWLLRYAARIRSGSLTSVSDGNQLKGNLAHRLYETFFNANASIASIDASSVNAWVDQHVEQLLQREGALLLEPGRQAEVERFITQLAVSLTTLVQHLQSAGAEHVQMELSQEGRFAGGKLLGSIDLLASRSDGSEAVIDIKWGGKKYRRDSLLANSYLQLATYAQLRRDSGASQAPALSYFIVKDAHMLSLDHTFFPNAEIITPDSAESAIAYWQRVEESWRWRRAQIKQGRIEVTITDTEPSDDSEPPASGLDLPEASDGFNDYHVLTGWDANA